MKKPITLVLALLTAVSFAQPYNKTYDVNGNGDKLTPAFVITDPSNFETITVSYGSDNNSPQLNYFVLTRHDATGNTLYNNVITPINAPTDGFTNVEALINTDDGGTLVAGHWYKDYTNIIEQPFLLKVDAAGNVQWIRIYHVNKSAIVNSSINKVSLCRVANESKERYFIVSCADSDSLTGKDVVVNVIKVEADGKFIFSKKYYEAQSPYKRKREYPGDIAFSKTDGQTFMITGYREDILQTSVARSMFFFAIDNNGNVITKFMTLTSKSVPIDQDMVFDASQGQGIFTTVFTHEKSTYIPGIDSEIGFISVDAMLNFYNPKILWHNAGTAHNGRSISLASQGNYLLGSGIYDPSSQLYNPGWLKVDGAGNPGGFPFLRYNTADNTIFGHHTVSDLGGSNEEFVLVNEQKTDLRVIRTDINGKACGMKKFEALVEKYDPKDAYFKYVPVEQGKSSEYKVTEKMFEPKKRECENNASSYRTAGIVSISGNPEDVRLYPSVIQSGNAILSIENNTGSTAKIEVRSVSGQLIFVYNEVAAGKTEVNLNNLAQGIYLVQIQDTNNKLISTQKIIATE